MNTPIITSADCEGAVVAYLECLMYYATSCICVLHCMPQSRVRYNDHTLTYHGSLLNSIFLV